MLKMRSVKKVAIFLASIPRDKAIEIMKCFTIQTVEKVASEIRSIGSIDENMQKLVFEELAEKIRAGVNPMGGEDVAWQLIAGVVGDDEAGRLLDRAQPKKPKPFSSLSSVGAQDLATILTNEKSSTTAIILSFLSPKKAGEVLGFLDEDKRDDIVVRLAQNREADRDVVERIERIFISKVSSSIREEEAEKNVLGGPEYVAEMFQAVDKVLEEELMTSVQEESSELADQIRDLMFTFEDISRLSDVDVQKVLREVQTESLVVALRGASNAVRDKFTTNLSKRARENLNDEMELLGKVKKSEIEAERRGIVAVVRGLESAGEVSISIGDDEDVYI